MTSKPAGRRMPVGWIASLALLGVLIGVAELPYQWLSELGFRLQGDWPLPGGRPGSVLLALLPVLGTALFLVLGWGPLAAGRGGGVTGILALQVARNEEEKHHALASLSLRHQVVRLPLVALTHLAGLSVGTESPSAALGAALLLALRERLQPLRQLPVALLAAIGGGAGLGAAFRSPLLGVAYALEELSGGYRVALIAPTLVLAGIGTAFQTGLGQPARLAEGGAAPLEPALLPLALLITVGAALVGLAFVRLLIPLAAVIQRLLHSRTIPAGLAISLAIGLVAIASAGISLNDGSLLLGPALAGDVVSPWWAPLPRVLGPLLSIAIGAPGGLMHDSMSLGAALASPWLGALAADQCAALSAVAAASLFSGACRTPLFCGLFVFTLQGNPSGLPVLLTAAAIAAGIGHWLGGSTWNEAQLEAFQRKARGASVEGSSSV